jgi:hypothetical protein
MRVLRKELIARGRDFVGDDGKDADLAPFPPPRTQLGEKAEPLHRPLFIQLGQEHAGQRPHLPGVEEEQAHEPFDPAFARPIGKIHAQRDFALQVECQPVFGTPRDRMQMAAHRPEEVFGAAERAVFDPGQ